MAANSSLPVCLDKATGLPGSVRPMPVMTTSSSLASPVWTGAVGLSVGFVGLVDFSIRMGLVGWLTGLEVSIGLSSAIRSPSRCGGSLGISSGIAASRSGVLPGSGTASSSAALSRRAFLLGLGLALKGITKSNTAYVPRWCTGNIKISMAYPSTVLSGGSWVADDSPEDEWEVTW